MRFAQLLTDYMRDRTLESVTSACAEKGVSITRATLSRYRRGERVPADDAVVKTLAEVLNRDPEPLVFLARLERSPQDAMGDLLDMAITVGTNSKQIAVKALNLLADVWQMVSQEKPHSEINALLSSSDYLNDMAERLTKADEQLLTVLKHALPELATMKVQVQETFSQSVGLPVDRAVGKQVALEESVGRFNLSLVWSEEELILELVESTGIPEHSLRAAIAALKASPGCYKRPRYVAPRTEAEREFVEVAEALLDRHPLGVHDDLHRLAIRDGKAFSGMEFIGLLEAKGWRLWSHNNPLPVSWRTVAEYAMGAQRVTANDTEERPDHPPIVRPAENTLAQVAITWAAVKRDTVRFDAPLAFVGDEANMFIKFLRYGCLELDAEALSLCSTVADVARVVRRLPAPSDVSPDQALTRTGEERG